MVELSALELTCELISKQSVTPNDADCQKIISSYLEDLGFAIQNIDNKHASNLWACLDRNKPCDLVFAGHTDVVPCGDTNSWKHPPFMPSILEGKLFGRGACDMKTALAAMCTATKKFIHNRNKENLPNIGFLITSSEEGDSSIGTEYALNHLPDFYCKYCIVGEPTSKETFGDIIKIGRRGSITFTITFIGKQGHVAYPDKAYNPNVDMISFLNKLNAIVWDNGNKDFPASNLEVTLIETGIAVNVIPGKSVCQFNIRFNTQINEEIIKTKVNELLLESKCDFDIEIKLSAFPFLNEKGSLFAAMSDSISELCNIATRSSTCGGTSDARFLTNHSEQLVEFGLLNESAHQIDEHCYLHDIDLLEQVYLSTMEKLFPS